MLVGVPVVGTLRASFAPGVIVAEALGLARAHIASGLERAAREAEVNAVVPVFCAVLRRHRHHGGHQDNQG